MGEIAGGWRVGRHFVWFALLALFVSVELETHVILIRADQKLPAAATTTEPKEGEEPTATAEDEDTEMKPATETAVPTPAGSTATTTLAVKELEMIPLSNSDSQLFIKSISPEITREELEAVRSFSARTHSYQRSTES